MLYSNTEMCLSNAIVCLSKRVSYDNDCSDNYTLAGLIGLLSQVNLDVALCEVEGQIKLLDEFYSQLDDAYFNGVISALYCSKMRRILDPVYGHFCILLYNLNEGA